MAKSNNSDVVISALLSLLEGCHIFTRSRLFTDPKPDPYQLCVLAQNEAVGSAVVLHPKGCVFDSRVALLHAVSMHMDKSTV